MYNGRPILRHNIAADPELLRFKQALEGMTDYDTVSRMTAETIDTFVYDPKFPERAFLLSESLERVAPTIPSDSVVPDVRSRNVLSLLTDSYLMYQHEIKSADEVLDALSHLVEFELLGITQEGPIPLDDERYGLVLKLGYYANQARGIPGLNPQTDGIFDSAEIAQELLRRWAVAFIEENAN